MDAARSAVVCHVASTADVAAASERLTADFMRRPSVYRQLSSDPGYPLLGPARSVLKHTDIMLIGFDV